MYDLTLIKQNGCYYIDSREVADAIGKRHDNLLRDIGKYREIMVRGGLLNFEESDFFVESSYFNAQNKVMPCYLLSKMGCELVANKLTGEKGVLFTIAYVTKFNLMEQQERAEREAALKSCPMPRMSEFNGAVKNVLNGMSQCFTAPDNVMKFLRGVYKPLGIRVDEDGCTACQFSATDIARITGMYSVTGKPHGHAVAAIIAKLNISESQMVAVPYGLVGISFRYDIGVVNAVADWLDANDYPSEVAHYCFDYHVRYKPEKAGIIRDGFFIVMAGCDNQADEYTKAELDEMCGGFGDCEDCPGFYACCYEE